MELVPVLRLIWRRRIALALGVVVALAVGLSLASGAAPREGVASTRLVLDTPVSQLIQAAPKGGDSLGWRTEVLSNLMTTVQARRQIAREAGVPLRGLEIVSPLLNTPVLLTTLPRRASAVAAGASAPFVLTVLADGTLPIIALQGRAPSRAAAVRLVAAAANVLKATASLPPEMTGTQAEKTGTQAVVVQDAGAIQAEEIIGGARKKRAAVAFLAVLLLWSAVVLILPAALRALHGARRRVTPA